MPNAREKPPSAWPTIYAQATTKCPDHGVTIYAMAGPLKPVNGAAHSIRQPPATRIPDKALIAGKRPHGNTHPLHTATPNSSAATRLSLSPPPAAATPKAPSRRKPTQDRPGARPQTDSARHRSPSDRRCSAPTNAGDRPAACLTPPGTRCDTGPPPLAAIQT